MTRCMRVLVAVGVLIGAAGCTKDAEAPTDDAPPPAGVSAAPDGVKHVTLSSDAVRRLGLQTAPVTAAAGHVRFPSSAVLYEPGGQAFVYVVVGPGNTYARSKVTLRSDAGGVADVTSGLRAGQRVVSLGAALVYGTEAQVEGEGG